MTVRPGLFSKREGYFPDPSIPMLGSAFVMELIFQEHPGGCGIAALAMLTGQSYQSVRDHYPRSSFSGKDDDSGGGLSTSEQLQYLSEHGYYTTAVPYPAVGEGVYLLRFDCHTAVMDASGAVLCPCLGRIPSLSEYPDELCYAFRVSGREY
jgi:hypothetical protein